MDALASPRSQLADRYDTVVVGSGYGGGVLASRLARADVGVAVLERGQERHPGHYPETLWRALRQVQLHTQRWDLGARTGLFDFRMTRDVGILVGCGLGGTSLINANVALEVDEQVLAHERWPDPLRGGLDAAFRAGIDRARLMLGTIDAPDPPELAKRTALRAAAEKLDVPYQPAPVNVRFTTGRNAAGVDQPACNGCGDCVTGCNVGAKGTVLMTYLPDAVRHGAKVFTGMAVQTVLPDPDGGWSVTYVLADRGSAPRVVHADRVVLAAGALGSTEILLRSAAVGLDVSPRLGLGLSGNADFLGFAYYDERPINGLGRGRDVDPGNPVGPTITGVIDLRSSRGTIIEEGAIPRALAPLVPPGLLLASLRAGHRTTGQRRRDDVRAVAPALVPGKAPGLRTQTLLAMGSDDDTGHVRLEHGRAVVHWPGAAGQRALRDDDGMVQQIASSTGGTYLRSPVWRSPLGDKYVTVHPLGGCDMATDAEHGVTDHRGRVFRGNHGAELHTGLVVADGSIVPCPLGANPSLTIAALAERIAQLELGDRGVGPDGAPFDPAPVTEPFAHRTHRPAELRFRERMAGTLVDPEGASLGPIELRMELETDEVARLLHDLAHPLAVHGEANAPGLAAGPLRITGTLRVIVPDHEVVDTEHMRYDLVLHGADGERLRLEAIKDIHDGRGFDVWRDTTTARVTVRAGAVEPGAVVALGTVRIGVLGVARMVASMRVDGVRPTTAALRIAQFGARFGGAILRTYGKLAAEGADFRDTASFVTPTRSLRLPEPETRWCRASGDWVDDVAPSDAWLRLVRYRGGTKGPVLVAPGFAMATSQFLMPTTPTNLTEHLVEAGYDVWLFDWRASIDLPSSRSDFTLDDVARRDWPTAIDEVRRVTGAADVQIVAHCVGSMTALMAVLAGAQGVRSIVSSQVTLHPVVHWFNKFKARIHLADVLRDMGARIVEPDLTPEWPDYLLDAALRLNPMLRGERCHNPVCRWVFGFFGPTHVHDQLDELTHAATARLFGVGDLVALEQLGAIVRAGHVVDHRGADVYLPFVERLAIPITFLAGRRNKIFLPETSQRTLQWLREHNDPELYERIELPDYAHLDALIGTRAHDEVFPFISQALDRQN